MNVLVINAGSSSLKYQLLDPATGDLLAKGLCERIGIDGKFTYGKQKLDAIDVAMPTHSEAIQAVLNALVDPENGVIASMSEIDAVGHRVVHGGEAFSSSVLITDEVMKAIEGCNPLAPLHNPANIIGINACKAALGDSVPQVAVFDTAFHQTMPPVPYTYPIPYEYYGELKGNLEGTRIITCHLGNGSSVAAIKGGKCIDTSMGLTPLAGLPMGTRAGDMDAGVMEFIMNKYNLDINQMMTILNKKSGVLGISEVSSDFRDLDTAAEAGNQQAQLAKDVFVYDVKKYIGAYAAAMGGVDAVVFTAGVGENSSSLRAEMVDGLEYMGIKMDLAKNDFRGEERDVTAEGATVKVLVIPTNEELMIAMDTAEIVKG